LIVLVVAASVRLPVVVSTFAVEKKLILPVPAAPSCKVCPLVVASVPVAVRYVALLFAADRDAVGVPPATLVNANFALTVALLPSSKSSVVFLSKMLPLPSLNGEPPLPIGRMPVTSLVARFTAEEERIPAVE